MRQKSVLLAAAVLFIAMLAGWQLSNYWGMLAARQPTTALQLIQFDTVVGSNSEACFTLSVRSTLDRETITFFQAASDKGVFIRKEVDVSQQPVVRECIAAAELAEGENLVRLGIGADEVFYHVEVVGGELEEKQPTVQLQYLGQGEFRVRVGNNDGFSYSPLEIFVNGELDHGLYPQGEEFESVERVELQQGKNEVRALFKGVGAVVEAEKPAGFKMNPLAGILLISLLVAFLALGPFGEKAFPERLCYSTLTFLAILMLSALILDVLSLLSAARFVALVAVLTAFIGVYSRKGIAKAGFNAKLNLRKTFSTVSPLLVLLICLFLFSSFSFNFFTETYYSRWTGYYERESAAIAAAEQVPATDQFSFLGAKPFGFISGYFFAKAGMLWLTGLPNQGSYAIIMLLSQMAFLASAFIFFKTFGFDDNRAYLAVAAMLLGGFVFADFSYNIRHVISVSMLLLSLAFLRQGKEYKSALLLGLAAFVQTPVFLMFLALLPVAVTKRETVKKSAKAAIIGGLVALALFAPTLLRVGMPTQAKSTVWGYLWAIPLYGFVLDYLAVFLLGLLFIVPFALNREVKIDRYALRLFCLVILFSLFQVSVSYRVNIVLTITLALLIACLFPKRLLQNRVSLYSLSIALAIAFALMFLIIISFYPIGTSEQFAYSYVKQNTSTSANFLVEPYLGHAFIFHAERKAVADLAVEYADEQMIEDSFTFLKEKDYSILRKYRVQYVVNRSIFLDEKPVGDNLYPRLIQFEQLDKVFSNQFFFVHRARE